MDQQTRQEFIRAAVSFLQNPKLIDSPLQDKLKFLRDKGLTEVELDEALNYALISRHQSQSGRWNFILILGLCIGGYKLYQAYLKTSQAEASSTPKTVTPSESPERQPKVASQELKVESIPQKAKELNDSYAVYKERDTKTLKDILEKVSELKRLIELQRTNFASDVQSLKTLLLGHEKFAAPPVIPSWQLPEKPREEKTEMKDGAKNANEGSNKKTAQMTSESVKKKGDSPPKHFESIQKNGESMRANGESAAK